MEQLQSPLFAGLTPSDWAEMEAAGCLRERAFAKGEAIFRTGTVIRCIGVVRTGSVLVESVDPWGNRSILSGIAAGQPFGETYALCGAPLMVDAVAAQPCTVLFLQLDMPDGGHRRPWQERLQQNLLAVCTRKNLTLSGRMRCLSAKSVRGRLAAYLSEQAALQGKTAFTIPFDRQQLADYLNLDRSALSKELGRMRREGLLDFRKNQFWLKQLPE